MNVVRTCVVALALFPATAAFAGHGGSMEDQIACTPDVYRYCSSQIPDEDAIVACLQQHKAVLSAACQRVFSEPNPGGGTGHDTDE